MLEDMMQLSECMSGNMRKERRDKRDVIAEK